MNSSNLPWLRIHDFLIETGSETDQRQFGLKAISNIDQLIPYDIGLILFVDQNRNIVDGEFLNLPDRWKDLYINYYDRIDPCKKKAPENARNLFTDWRQYWHTEFGTDYVKANGIRYTTGIVLQNRNQQIASLLILCRSDFCKGFTEQETEILKIIQPHLAILYRNLDIINANNNPQTKTDPSFSTCIEECRQLTKREKEIVLLLCQGLDTQGISSRLFLSPGTVYRHISNIFEKNEGRYPPKTNCQNIIPKLKRTFLTNGLLAKFKLYFNTLCLSPQTEIEQKARYSRAFFEN